MSKPITIHTVESLMDRVIEVGECWEWQRYSHNNVPQVFNGEKMVPVRRLFADLLGKPFPEGGYIVPRCDESKCVNPAHAKHYTERAFSLYRARRAAKSHAGNLLRSAKIQAHKRATVAKITQEQADEIRLSTRPSREEAKIYGIDKSLVCRIRAGKAWVRLAANPFVGLMR
jgi:hypothetical protein